MSNDGIPGRVADQQQQQQGAGTSSNYEAHQMSYFDQDPNNANAATAQSHSHSLQQQQQSAEGSPANTSASATNTGGSAASTSLGGISASADQQQQPQGSSSASSPHTENSSSIVVPIPQRAQQQQAGEPKSSSSGGPTASSSSSSNSYQSAIKLMVSNNVAGSIIGRAGQTISDLQSQSSARIKLSQTGDYYPGTQDRVCLVQGQLGTVKHAVKLLLERFYMLQEQQHTQHSSWQPRTKNNANTNTNTGGNNTNVAANANAPTTSTAGSAAGFDFVVRLLVPSSSCGMIIGKGGVNIKHMEESSGVTSVRLSPKESPEQSSHAHAHPATVAVRSGTLERVVTLTGPTLESCVSCISIVIDCMSANHEICRYTNMTTSYSRHVMAAPGSYAPVQPGQRSLVHHSQHSHSSIVPQHASGTIEWDVSNQGAAAGVYGSPFMIKRSTSQPDLSHMSIEQVGLLRAQSRMSQESFGGSAVSASQQQQIGQQREVSTVQQQFNSSFMDLPQAYNNSERGQQQPMLGVAQDQNRGQQRSNNNNPSSNIAPMYLLGSPASTHSQLDQHPSMQSSTSAPDLLALQFQDSLRISNSQQAGQGGGQAQATDYSHFAAQIAQPTQPGFTAQVLVPDNLIGSILGRGGSTLNDLQMHSNTRIRISQRGEYVPGTRNRIVTIRGQTAHGVNFAQYLMNERMALPPTAGFATNTGGQPADHAHLTAAAPPYAIHQQHPTTAQLQQQQQPYPQQRMPFHQSTQTAVPVADSHSSTAQQQQALSGTAVAPPLTLSLNNSSDNDLTLHR